MTVVVPAISHKIRMERGDDSVLKGQKALNFEFVYDGLAVGKFANESDYIAKKKSDYNA